MNDNYLIEESLPVRAYMGVTVLFSFPGSIQIRTNIFRNSSAVRDWAVRDWAIKKQNENQLGANDTN